MDSKLLAAAWAPPVAWVAIFNGIAGVLLVLGFVFIRQRRLRAHKRAMLSAFACSILFMVVYVWHHLVAGITYFHRTGPIRTVYFLVLGTHTPLAAIVPVLAIITIALALRGNFSRHKRWARWTLPIWLYVSVTGVAVYWMLFRM
ncbi:MAG: DUF420 domain-containing protein [Terriglobales bacterium]